LADGLARRLYKPFPFILINKFLCRVQKKEFKPTQT
jgi:hypothetical protein